MLNVFDKNGNQKQLLEKSDYIEYLGYITNDTSIVFDVPKSMMMLMGVFNSYNVGCLYLVQTGSNYDTPALNPIVSNDYYFKFEAVAGRKVKVKSGGANGYVFIVKFNYQ